MRWPMGYPIYCYRLVDRFMDRPMGRPHEKYHAMGYV